MATILFHVVSKGFPVFSFFFADFSLFPSLWDRTVSNGYTFCLLHELDYLIGPFSAGPLLTPAPLTPALITPVTNCKEYRI